MESILFGFVWAKKGDKIKRTKLVQSYTQDGLQMLDLKAFVDSMKLSRLKRLAGSKADWSKLAYEILPSVPRLLTFGKGKLTAIRNQIRNRFYVDMLNVLIRYVSEHKPSPENIVSESIWFSDYLINKAKAP